jgi:hypothetical protein
MSHRRTLSRRAAWGTRVVALDYRRGGEHPSIAGGVVDLQAALQQHLPDIVVAERLAQLPGRSLLPGRGLHDQSGIEEPVSTSQLASATDEQS